MGSNSATATRPGRSGLYQKILYSEEQVAARIAEMAGEIARTHDPRTTIFVGLLNGAQPFAAKLMAAIWRHDPAFHPNLQTMIISRYGQHREPGVPRVVTDLPPEYRQLAGRHVVLLDDLIDGGETLRYAREYVLGYGADSVGCAVLVKKVKDPPVRADGVMYGFEAPDVWLTGMGMDDARLGPEANRWAGWIAAANSSGM